jgi:hypothetical protein
MKTLSANQGMSSMQVGMAIALALLLFFIVAFFWRQEEANWLQSALARAVQKRHLLQTMSRDLLASVEAEKSAVMAESDEDSQAFAQQSMQAAQHVEKTRQELEPLLEDNSQEASLFREFSACWDKLQGIDREVLALAVQNTNLKALRLSFIPAAEALKRLETALNHLIDLAADSPDAVSITRLAAESLAGAFHIHALQAPHIAETRATRMDEIETAMQSFDRQVNDAFQHLQVLVGEPGKPYLQAARTAYQDFHTINTTIVHLSRQNSNIQSYALSLGEKRKRTAQCLQVLAALQETIQHSMAIKATR